MLDENGQYTPSNPNNDWGKMLEGTVGIFIILTLAMVLVKKMWYRPVAALIFLGSGILAVMAGYYITHDNWEFWVLAAISVISLGKVIQ